MPAPIDYMSRIPQINLEERLLSGLRLGQALGEMKQASELRQKNEQFKKDFANILQNPSWESTSQLVAKYPEFADKIQAAKKLYSDEENKREFDYSVQAFRAATTGNVDIAKQLTQQQIDALKNTGKPVDEYEKILKNLDTNTKATAGLIGAIGAAANPEKWKAITEADVARRRMEAEAAGTEAQTRKAQAEAEFAKQQQQAELAKRAADLGLTTAQTNKVLVETNKLGNEAQKAALELSALKATGGIDPEKRFNQENTIRTQYQNRAANYGKVRDAYATIEASANDKTGAGDIALVTSFMKMLDPGSVVRETEFANAQNTAGLLEKLKNQAEKLQTGAFLDPKQRASFTSLAKKYLDAANEREGQIRKQYEKTVKTYNLDYENVFGVPPSDQKTPPAPPAGSPASAGGAPAQKKIVVSY